MFTHQPSGLYLTKFRAYDPFSGRWLSRDPVGEFVGGINLYAFEDEDPVYKIDPTGTQGIPGAIVGALSGAAGGLVGTIANEAGSCKGLNPWQIAENTGAGLIAGGAVGAFNAAVPLETAGDRIIGGGLSGLITGGLTGTASVGGNCAPSHSQPPPCKN